MVRAGGTRAKNGRTAVVLSAVALGMIGLSFASVPLYRVLTQITGIGGTTQVAEVLPSVPASNRVFEVRFNTDIDPRLPWAFQPVRRSIVVRAGEPSRAVFRVRNLGGRANLGKAAFNATPMKIGKYFTKVECFCFGEQWLEPGQEADLAVRFFVDPAILEDRNVDEVRTITLSYTFFRQADRETDGAQSGSRATRRTALAKSLN